MVGKTKMVVEEKEKNRKKDSVGGLPDESMKRKGVAVLSQQAKKKQQLALSGLASGVTTPLPPPVPSDEAAAAPSVFGQPKDVVLAADFMVKKLNLHRSLFVLLISFLSFFLKPEGEYELRRPPPYLPTSCAIYIFSCSHWIDQCRMKKLYQNTAPRRIRRRRTRWPVWIQQSAQSPQVFFQADQHQGYCTLVIYHMASTRIRWEVVVSYCPQTFLAWVNVSSQLQLFSSSSHLKALYNPILWMIFLAYKGMDNVSACLHAIVFFFFFAQRCLYNPAVLFCFGRVFWSIWNN